MVADMGDVQAITIDPATGLRLGASDPRSDGVTLVTEARWSRTRNDDAVTILT